MFGRMSRKDRHAWASATSIADLGHLTACWLEGSIKHQPGYLDTKPAPETRTLIPTLARLNRAGFLTTDSQPGHRDAASEQRAAVHGFIADQRLFARLRSAVNGAGLLVATGRQVAVTTVRGEEFTWFGGTIPQRDLEFLWGSTVGSSAFAELRRARQVAFIDPSYGDSDRLWQTLRRAVGG